MSGVTVMSVPYVDEARETLSDLKVTLAEAQSLFAEGFMPVEGFMSLERSLSVEIMRCEFIIDHEFD